MRRINIAEEGTETRFLANMSHEIRTPMNSIMGFLELALEDPDLAPQHKSNLTTALNSSQHLLTLINNILDLSKIESGAVAPVKRQFDLPVLLDTLQSKWGAVANEKHITFTVSASPSISGFYMGDSLIIEKVLSLVIENAVKFTEHGSVTMKVHSDTPGTILFSVVDTGIGIHPTYIKEVFEPFTQGDSTNSRSYEGVGLGAAIAKKFTEVLGGDITVESIYGEGSVFTVALPLESSVDTYLPADSSGKESVLRNRRFNILLVDDIETNLELARVHLHRRGQNVDLATNGLEAIEQCELSEYDVILMDIHMPIMDGVEAMTHIRKMEGDSKHTYIIALTADVMGEVHTPLVDKGFDDVVEKPVRFDDLMEMLQMTLPEECGVPVDAEEKSEPLVEQSSSREYDRETVGNLLEDIMDMLNLYNPGKVQPLLNELGQIVQDNRYIRSICGLVDAFDFERAIHELQRLAHSLGYELRERDV